MVGYPKDVEAIYFGQDGIIQNARPGTCLIDMTTSSPSLAKRIFKEALSKNMFALDAPVTGGDVGAREARLTIMVGGEESVFEKVKSHLSIMGSNIVYHGIAGAGQYTKLCNQIAIASNMIGVAETIAFAQKAGLDPLAVLRTLESGTARSYSLSNHAPRMIAGNFSPGFYIKHFLKDITIAIETAKEMKMEAPGLQLAKSLYERLVAMGEENSGTQALFKLYHL